MAVITPAERPPGDTRPVYNKDQLPGGPWNAYRPRGWVNAHLVTGPWLFLRPDGNLVEREGPTWVVQDPVSLALTILTPEEFAAAYEPVGR